MKSLSSSSFSSLVKEERQLEQANHPYSAPDLDGSGWILRGPGTGGRGLDLGLRESEFKSSLCSIVKIYS